MSGAAAGAPLVSVVVAAYQRPDYVKQAVDSVLSQAFDGCEIIVVDDCSDEETYRRYDLPECVRLIRHETRRRCAAARNTGIHAARGRFIALLDMDDVWLPGKLCAQVKALSDNPQAALTYCHCTRVDDSLALLADQLEPRAPGADPLWHMLEEAFIMTPSAVLVRREALEECGLFDESVVGPSDWDLWIRMLSRYVFHMDPEPRVLYRIHAQQTSGDGVTMAGGEACVLEKTVSWMRTERPDLARAARRKLAGALRALALAQVAAGDRGAALRAALRAIAAWPSNVKSYRVLARLLLQGPPVAR